MCRFLIVRQKEEFDPVSLLREFASACQERKTPEGDWQGDGWGIAWQDKKGNWELEKSLSPIWEDTKQLESIPPTRLLAVHARSASFPSQKGDLDFNQPYIADGTCFVFNGLLRKVRLRVPGEIGAQKIWWLLNQRLGAGKNIAESLKEVRDLLYENSQNVRGFNVGVVRGDEIGVLCDYSEDKGYFTLWRAIGDATIVCSEPLSGYNLSPMKKGQIKVL